MVVVSYPERCIHRGIEYYKINYSGELSAAACTVAAISLNSSNSPQQENVTRLPLMWVPIMSERPRLSMTKMKPAFPESRTISSFEMIVVIEDDFHC